MKQAPYTPPSVLRLFPSEGVLRYVKTWDNHRSYLSSSHTSLYCPAGAQSTWSPWRQRCAHALWSYLLRADRFCSSAPSAAVTAPELLPTFASGSVIQLLFVLLPFLVWFYTNKSFMLQKDTKKISAPIPPVPTSILLISRDSTAQKLLQPNAENWFLHPVSAVNACPCASSTAGDNTAPWITFTG